MVSAWGQTGAVATEPRAVAATTKKDGRLWFESLPAIELNREAPGRRPSALG